MAITLALTQSGFGFGAKTPEDAHIEDFNKNISELDSTQKAILAWKLMANPEAKIFITESANARLHLYNAGSLSDGYHTFDELYEHRIVNYMALCRQLSRYSAALLRRTNPVWRTRIHSDGTEWPGWFILGIFTEPGKQITYHLPMSKWDECDFAQRLNTAPKWDGHTSADVLERLKNL